LTKAASPITGLEKFAVLIGPYKGVRQVGHSGSTAGYRAHLVEFPDQKVAVGVLCNVSSGAATQYAQSVADLYLGSAITTGSGPARPVNTYALKTEEIDDDPADAGLCRRISRRYRVRPLSTRRVRAGHRTEHQPGSRVGHPLCEGGEESND
jgi:hypothetical protein